MGNSKNKEKRRAYERSISPYCYCQDEEIPEGISLDELASWCQNHTNNDPIVGFQTFQAPECYGGHLSEWATRKCLDCGKIYSDCPGWA